MQPLLAQDSASSDRAGMVYTSLLRYNKQMDLEGELAKSYKVSDDKLSISFELKDNLVWSDGQPITADDVKWSLEMYADEKGSRFDPVNITIKRGDGIRWTLVNGPPHNVAFWPDSIPAGASSVLQGNMADQMATLAGPMMLNPNQTYTISFTGVPAGTYHYYCVPHLALGMKGIITVQ
jgi:plastocyanin